VGAKPGLDAVEKRKTSCLPRIEPQDIQYVVITTELSGLHRQKEISCATEKFWQRLPMYPMLVNPIPDSRSELQNVTQLSLHF
jgi:hypothetical protein